MKVAMLLLFFVLVGATAVLTYWNRGHEKVINLYVAAIVGAVGALATILLSLEARTVDSEFPIVYIYNRETKKPIWLPTCQRLQDYTFKGAFPAIRDILATRKDLVSSPDGGTDIYLSLATGDVFRSLFPFYTTWLPKVRRFDLPDVATIHFEPAEPDLSSIDLKGVDLERLFPDVPSIAGPAELPIKLPPETRASSKSAQHTNTLILTNRFVTVTITVSYLMSQLGTVGLGEICNMSDQEASQFFVSTYVLTVHAAFSRWRSGAPEMARYAKWVEGLISALRNGLDAELAWKRAKDHALARAVR